MFVMVLLAASACGGSSDTVVPVMTSTAAPTTTAVPTTTVALTTTAVPTTTVALTTRTTVAPTTTVALTTTTTVAPTTTVALTTTTPTPTAVAPATTTQSEVQFGVGGLVADLESWADRDLPRFITASHIDISDVERISRFRSNAGHDYSDSFETCCSMKHYFYTINYYEVRFTQPIYSPVDGVVLYVAEGDSGADDWRVDYEQVTGKSPPNEYRDLKMYIRPDDAPNLWVRFHHVSPIEELLDLVPLSSGVDRMRGVARPPTLGFRVRAGDLIGHGLGEISVEKHLDGNGVPSPCNSESQRSAWGEMPGCASKRQFHSIFEFMTDEVFEQYRAVADVTRDDFMISTEERSANPLRCEGEDFVIRDVGAYVFLQGSTGAAASTAPATTMAPTTTFPPLPDIKHFATNKSNRFLVDFEDIIAGHPFVGQRSPAPHNDAQVYFSNSDPRWLQASQPSDYPAVYAVADGVIAMAEGELSYFNVRDKTGSDPPWYHVLYGFNLRFATIEGESLVFNYSLEPYVTLHDRPRDFFKDFLLVKDGQRVKKGDLLAYMYVSPFEERLNGPTSAHIAFTLMKEQGNPWDVYPPAIFTEEIVEKFASIYRHPTEGWDSTSYGRDWNRARGLPTAMGWMIEADENPFTNVPLDVLVHDGVRDLELDGSADLEPSSLGFNEADILYEMSGSTSMPGERFEMEGPWRSIIGSVGGPLTVTATTFEANGSVRTSNYFSSRAGMPFSQQVTPVRQPGTYQFTVSNPGGWPWAIGVASEDAIYSIPGDNLPQGFCPPGCPPLPSGFDGPPADIGEKSSYD